MDCDVFKKQTCILRAQPGCSLHFQLTAQRISFPQLSSIYPATTNVRVLLVDCCDLPHTAGTCSSHSDVNNLCKQRLCRWVFWVVVLVCEQKGFVLYTSRRTILDFQITSDAAIVFGQPDIADIIFQPSLQSYLLHFAMNYITSYEICFLGSAFHRFVIESNRQAMGNPCPPSSLYINLPS